MLIQKPIRNMVLILNIGAGNGAYLKSYKLPIKWAAIAFLAPTMFLKRCLTTAKKVARS